MHPQQLSLCKVMAGSGKNATGKKVGRWAGGGWGGGVRAALGVRGQKMKEKMTHHFTQVSYIMQTLKSLLTHEIYSPTKFLTLKRYI